MIFQAQMRTENSRKSFFNYKKLKIRLGLLQFGSVKFKIKNSTRSSSGFENSTRLEFEKKWFGPMSIQRVRRQLFPGGRSTVSRDPYPCSVA